MVTLERIRAQAQHAYPTRVLTGGDALVLFAAAFHGAQDAAFVEQAGMTATCVDRDHGKLAEMLPAYPADWEFVNRDVWAYTAMTTRRWDVVSLDPFTGDFQRCADAIDVWCQLARRAVVLGTGVGTEVDPPAGWRVTEVMPRSRKYGGVYWTVLEPC